MSNRFIEFVKQHPYGVAAGAAFFVGAYLLLGAGKNAPAGGVQQLGASAAEVQAASQYQIAQLQANQASAVSANQTAVANNQISAETIATQLKSTDTLASIAAQRDISLTTSNLSAETTRAVSLLQAQVAENQQAANIESQRINANAYVTIASLPFTSLTPQLVAQIQANTKQNAELSSAIINLHSEQIANVNLVAKDLLGVSGYLGAGINSQAGDYLSSHGITGAGLTNPQ